MPVLSRLLHCSEYTICNADVPVATSVLLQAAKHEVHAEERKRFLGEK